MVEMQKRWAAGQYSAFSYVKSPNLTNLISVIFQLVVNIQIILCSSETMKVNILGLPHFYNFPIKKCIITETIMMSIKVIHFYHVSRQ